MRIRDENRETEFYTDDKRVIAKANKEGSGYVIVSEETPEQAREKEVNALRRDDLVKLAESYQIDASKFTKNEQYAKAILTFERERVNAPAAERIHL